MSPIVKSQDDVTFGRHLNIMGDGVFANRDLVASLNTSLKGSAALTPGTYTFRLTTKGASGVEAFLKPTAINIGGGQPTCRLYKIALDDATQRGTNYNPDVVLAAAVMTRLQANDLRGEDAVYLEIVVPASSSVTFGAAAIAEYCTL